jgi:hypothetical protein
MDELKQLMQVRRNIKGELISMRPPAPSPEWDFEIWVLTTQALIDVEKEIERMEAGKVSKGSRFLQDDFDFSEFMG